MSVNTLNAKGQKMQEPKLAGQYTSKKKKSKHGIHKAINLDLIKNGDENKLMVTIPPKDFTTLVGKNVKYLGNYLDKSTRDYTRTPIEVRLSAKKEKNDMMWAKIIVKRNL